MFAKQVVRHRSRTFLDMFSLVVFLAVFGCAQRALSLAQTSDLQLDGASVVAFAQGGGRTYAATEGPKGIWILEDDGNLSTDCFEGSWRFAQGGSYTSGDGAAVLATSDKVFAVLGGEVYYAEHPDAGALPVWSTIDLGLSEGGESQNFTDEEDANVLSSDGVSLFVSSNYGKVYSVSLNPVVKVGEATLPGVDSPASIPRLAIDTSDSSANYIFAFKGIFGGSAGQVLRAIYSYNGTSAVIGDFSEVFPSGVSGILDSRLGGVYSSGNGSIYVTTFGLDTDQGGGVYRSTAQGAQGSFNKIGFSGEIPSGIDLNIRGTAFSGGTHIIGRFISTNGGTLFRRLTNDATSDGLSVNGSALLLNSTDSNCILASASIGPIYTGDQGASSWSESRQGLRGVPINDIAQNTSANLTVLGLTGGLAISTDSLTGQDINYSLKINDGNSAELGVVFAVAIDPDNDDTVYFGTSSLNKYQRAADSVSTIANSRGTLHVSDIAIGGSKLWVSYEQTNAALDGEIKVFDRSTLSAIDTVLEGLPVSALAVISETVIYAGVGGTDTIESSDGGTTRGLYRVELSSSTATATKITSNKKLKFSAIKDLAYDSNTDTLFVAGNGFFETDGGGDDDNGDDDSDEDIEFDIGAGDRDESGTIFILTKASGSNPKISVPIAGLSDDAGLSGVTFDSKTGKGEVYAAQENRLFVSNSRGERWALYYEGLDGEDTSKIFFDDLVQASNAGFSGLSGAPALVISDITRSVSPGSRSKLQIKLSKDYDEDASNLRRIKIRGADVKFRLLKRNSLSLALSPRRAWPSSTGTVRVTIPASFRAADGESIDSDYDGAQGGATFSQRVKIR